MSQSQYEYFSAISPSRVCHCILKTRYDGSEWHGQYSAFRGSDKGGTTFQFVCEGTTAWWDAVLISVAPQHAGFAKKYKAIEEAPATLAAATDTNKDAEVQFS